MPVINTQLHILSERRTVIESKMAKQGKIVVTGMGMVSSLGCDVVTACAAARAGLMCTKELSYYNIRSPEDGEVSSLIGCPVQNLSRGFEGSARLQRLLEGALVDLVRQGPDLLDVSVRTAFYLSFPDPCRLLANETTSRLAPSQEPVQTTELGARLLQNAARVAGWTGHPELRDVSIAGHSGVAQMMARAVRDLAEGRIGMAVVAAVDSLLEEETLSWLDYTQRLKTPGMPVGLRPGEAATVVTLETDHAASARRARKLATIQEIRLAEDHHTLLSRAPPNGAVLADLLAEVVGRNGIRNRSPTWLITDQNGESYRAMEWGLALVRMQSRGHGSFPHVIWRPAASFGDTSAASGGVALCIAARAFERGYAPSLAAVIMSTSDGPERATFLLEDPDS